MSTFFYRCPARPIAAALGAALLLSSFAAQAQSVGALQVLNPVARATVAQQPNGAAYLTIQNKGKESDALVSASTPVAASVELHSMAMEGTVMRMREVGKVAVEPNATVTMKPGEGYHLMLIGLKQPLKAGDKFNATLVFEKSGKTEVTFLVQDRKSSSQTGHAGSMQQHSGHGDHKH